MKQLESRDSLILVYRHRTGGPIDSRTGAAFTPTLDALVYATGFDAMTGASSGQLGVVTGRDGVTLADKIKRDGGYRTYLGMMTKGFPNAFFMVGPQSVSVSQESHPIAHEFFLLL